MRKAITTKTIDAFKPKAKRYEVHDILCPGFTLRVYPTGRKVFTVKYRYGLKQCRLPLGIYPRLQLADARERALEALRQVDEGIVAIPSHDRACSLQIAMNPAIRSKRDLVRLLMAGRRCRSASHEALRRLCAACRQEGTEDLVQTLAWWRAGRRLHSWGARGAVMQRMTAL